VRLLPGTSAVLEDNWVPVPVDTKLLAGTPVYAVVHAGRWTAARYVGPEKQGNVVVQFDDLRGQEQVTPPARLAIAKEILERLKQPDAGEQFARDEAEACQKWSDERRKQAHPRDYAAQYPLDESYEPIPERGVIRRGEPLHVFWGFRWNPVRVEADCQSGPVEIRWTERGGVWREFISRKSLFRSVANRAAGDAETPNTDPGKSAGYRIVLTKAGKRRAAVLQVVIQATGLSIKDARELVDAAPVTLADKLTKDKANALRKEIEAAGGEGRVEGATE